MLTLHANYHTMLICKTFKKQPMSAFFDLKASAFQLKERAGFLFNLYFIHLMRN